MTARRAHDRSPAAGGRPWRHGVSGRSGWSLLELMIATALIGLLLAIAVPGYQQYLLRAHRVSAIELLLSAAHCQERIRAAELRYDTARCLPSDPSGRYQFQFLDGTPASMGFTLLAEPLSAQRDDPCGGLSLDQSGWRDISGPAERLRRCWETR